MITKKIQITFCLLSKFVWFIAFAQLLQCVKTSKSAIEIKTTVIFKIITYVQLLQYEST